MSENAWIYVLNNPKGIVFLLVSSPSHNLRTRTDYDLSMPYFEAWARTMHFPIAYHSPTFIKIIT